MLGTLIRIDNFLRVKLDECTLKLSNIQQQFVSIRQGLKSVSDEVNGYAFKLFNDQKVKDAHERLKTIWVVGMPDLLPLIHEFKPMIRNPCKSGVEQLLIKLDGELKNLIGKYEASVPDLQKISDPGLYDLPAFRDLIILLNSVHHGVTEFKNNF
jgi:hypothetical protein